MVESSQTELPQEIIDEVRDQSVMESCVKFMKGSVKVKLGYAQQTVNLNDHANVAVVFDMRT
jgi:hypothetical protein